jgi:hypothetical protein
MLEFGEAGIKFGTLALSLVTFKRGDGINWLLGVVKAYIRRK